MSSTTTRAGNGALDRFFHITERGSTLRTEVLGGLTIFFAVSYILVVNPNIMKDSGMPFAAIAAGTAICCMLSTLIMGLWANYPIAMAPSMGINAFVAYVMCGSMGLTWQQSLAVIFLAGLLFFVLSVTHVRRMIVEAVPSAMRNGIIGGLGLFLAFIGLANAGVIVAGQGTLVTLGDVKSPPVLLTFIGIAITGFLFMRHVKGSFLLGIVATTIIGIPLGVVKMPRSLGDLFTLVPADPSPVLFHLDFSTMGSIKMITLVLSFTLIGMFDAMGTLIAIASKAGWVHPDGHVNGLDRALMADSAGTTVGTLFGGTVSTAYIESSVGVAEGARTGLAAVVAGLGFLVALFCTPLIALVPMQATAPVLVLVGLMMMEEVAAIDFTNLSEAFPAFVIILMMPLTYSIATAISLGFVAYVLFKLLSGQWRQIHPIMAILGVLFCLNMVFGYTVGG